MAKKISQLTQATEVKSDDVTVIVQDGETKKLPLNMMVTKQDIENKKIAGLAKLDEIEATYENDTYTPTITVKNKSSVKVGEGDGVDYSANVMDGHVKSAILKGNTLENLTYGVQLPLTQNVVDFRVKGMESGKKYTIFYDVEAASSTNLPKVGIVGQAKENSGASWLIHQSNIPLGTGKVVLTMPSFYSISSLRIHKNTSLNEPITLNNLMLLEGDYTNVDIPFFDGIQSVKMPVLTTTGKNLFDLESFSNIDNWIKSTYSSFKIQLSPNTQYVLSRKDDSGFGLDVFVCLNENMKTSSNSIGWIIHGTGTNNKVINFTTNNSGIVYINVYQLESSLQKILELLKEMQIEQGTTVTSYEPYKSNILSTPEDLELRGIGNVKDTLDLTTGEVVQNIYEFTLDGSQNIDNEGDLLYYYLPFGIQNNKSICDKLPSITVGQFLDGLIGIAPQNRESSSRVYIKVNGITTKEEMKNFFLNNPTTIQCELATPTIKTVDLIPSGTHPSTTPYCWKDGHIQLSSSGLLPNLEYSVVTSRAGQISQNAAMIVKNDKRIFDLEILLAGGLVNTTYQALTLQNQVETGLSKVSLSSEKEPDYLLYHMIMKLIEEKAYKLDDLTEKVSVFYLYEKLSDKQFETIYSALYPFVEDEIVEEPVVEELPEVVEDEVIM